MSDNGWRVVQEYETHQLASDSDDEKRIVKAEARAAKKVREEKASRSALDPLESRSEYSYSHGCREQVAPLQRPVVMLTSAVGSDMDVGGPIVPRTAMSWTLFQNVCLSVRN
ncbi:hypothetical protein FSP39_018533 [Pinctada imbricata]|uniref:Uncharacterized protein n=1 Tax=Pinctada imbricata TaxID=66713 RepID=A0AA89BTA3_PINIB|nr:hypothetical protein FSP39_018533 [Pinctada imbricata]